jgi:putative ABC transport system substrate-binding protein
MKRREFITVLGGAAAAWPGAAGAQQRPTMPVIGYLSTASFDREGRRLSAFRQGLMEAGYAEGRNVAIDYCWGEDQYDRFPALVAELVRRQVSVIVVNGVPAARAAKAATTTIPIVFQMGADPVEVGLVPSLNRPGGNLTGVAGLGVEVGPKRLELLRELIPAATSMAVLVNPANATVAAIELRDMQAAARTLGVQLHVLHASTERDFDEVLATLAQRRAGGLVISNAGLFRANSSPRWRCTTRCPRSFRLANLLRLAD